MTTNTDTIYPSVTMVAVENTINTNHNNNHDCIDDMFMDDLNDHYNTSSNHFRCVHCLYPSPALFRRLGSSISGGGGGSSSSGSSNTGSSDIQLLSCDYCRHYSSVYNIHTTNTSNSSNNNNSNSNSNNRLMIIDPYCERELLLILMDVFVLFRISAYRHLLYNRYNLLSNHNINNMDSVVLVSNHDKEEKEDERPMNHSTKPTTSTVPPPPIPPPPIPPESSLTSRQPQQQRLYHIGFIFLMCVLIRSHICIIASNHESISIRSNSNSNNNNNYYYYLIQQWMMYIILSALGYMIQIIGTILLVVVLILCGCVLFYDVLLRMSKRKRNHTVSSTATTTTTTTNTTTSALPTNDHNTTAIIVTSVLSYISFICSISILYPSLCIHCCTSILHIWENSNTVRYIGSMIILLHQWIFVQQIIYIITMTPHYHHHYYYYYHHHQRMSQPITTMSSSSSSSSSSSNSNSNSNRSRNTIFWMIFQWISLVLIWIAIIDLKSQILQWCYTQFTSILLSSSSSSSVFVSQPDTTIMMTCPGLDGKSLILFVERILGWSNHSVTIHHIESICFA